MVPSQAMASRVDRASTLGLQHWYACRANHGQSFAGGCSDQVFPFLADRLSEGPQGQAGRRPKGKTVATAASGQEGCSEEGHRQASAAKTAARKAPAQTAKNARSPRPRPGNRAATGKAKAPPPRVRSCEGQSQAAGLQGQRREVGEDMLVADLLRLLEGLAPAQVRRVVGQRRPPRRRRAGGGAADPGGS